ncbi:amino acid transporter [Synechocystis sp. LKSZ1]|uniref:amino acid transporter n=1 Tax=Synechocystis sp. LKSZ1 TaxID=3144951 RepID=UPI00336C232F
MATDHATPLAQVMGWLLQEEPTTHARPVTHPWWQVMCLTGVDYFSTLGYQPGIAALAAGSVAPFATLILVLVTLFGALPVYRRVASRSPHGQGSLAMLERLLPWWQGKLFILCLLGFIATDFIITITLSAADATAHLIENPLLHRFLEGQTVSITLVSIGLLGLVFLKGFREAIAIAVLLVLVYLSLNLVVIAVSMQHLLMHPDLVPSWWQSLFTQHGNPVSLVLMAALLFPRLALGLSGFETGVVVMPLVEGYPQDREAYPKGRIRQTYRLLTTAAVIMSFFLLTSSLVTILLIPPEAFQPGGVANGRALAYLAHQYLGEGFGTIYDLSTITILWFAGASAMAGLLNVVPRYLPRYGMAPDWARRSRPLVLVYTAIAFVVTILFQASVDAQGAAYATGVLVLISSAAFAVTLATYRQAPRSRFLFFVVITLIFVYTTIANIVERPDGIKIATFFILSIITTSLISRIWRSTEIRTEMITLDETAQAFVQQESQHLIRIIANRRNTGDEAEYYEKEREVREDNHIPTDESVLFLEIDISDASEFVENLAIEGVKVGPYRILRAHSAAVPNAIAAILIYLREQTGKTPHAYFGWPEGNPVQYLLRFLLFGEGDIAIVTREVLRRAEKNPERRPAIHVGG